MYTIFVKKKKDSYSFYWCEKLIYTCNMEKKGNITYIHFYNLHKQCICLIKISKNIILFYELKIKHIEITIHENNYYLQLQNDRYEMQYENNNYCIHFMKDLKKFEIYHQNIRFGYNDNSKIYCICMSGFILCCVLYVLIDKDFNLVSMSE